jgi:predicted nucleic acid-binding Zn ribbon protein
MHCSACGKVIPEQSVYCQHCGHPIKGNKPKDHWETFKSFWMELGVVGAVLVFIGAQFSASSVTALVDGAINPSLQGTSGITVWNVFIKTLPFTLAIAAIVIHTATGQLGEGYQAFGVIALYLAGGMGLSFALSAWLSEDILAVNLSRNGFPGPVGAIWRLISSFFIAYGPVAFVQSIILGGFFGYWVVRLQKTK